MLIDIDEETIDKMVLSVLVSHYKMNEEFIEELEAKEELADFQREDLEYDRKLVEHLDALIRYFTTDADYERIMK